MLVFVGHIAFCETCCIHLALHGHEQMFNVGKTLLSLKLCIVIVSFDMANVLLVVSSYLQPVTEVISTELQLFAAEQLACFVIF